MLILTTLFKVIKNDLPLKLYFRWVALRTKNNMLYLFVSKEKNKEMREQEVLCFNSLRKLLVQKSALAARSKYIKKKKAELTTKRQKSSKQESSLQNLAGIITPQDLSDTEKSQNGK